LDEGAFLQQTTRLGILEALTIRNAAVGKPVTTMMLRNIPRRYTQEALMDEINAFGCKGAYDFLYLPIDMHNRWNVGHAFINFISPEVAELFRLAFTGYRFGGEKACGVCASHIQGLAANLLQYEKRVAKDQKTTWPAAFRVNQKVRSKEVLATAKLKVLTEEASVTGAVPEAVMGSQQEQQASDNCRAVDPRQGLEQAIRQLLALSQPKQATQEAQAGVPAPPGLGGPRPRPGQSGLDSLTAPEGEEPVVAYASSTEESDIIKELLSLKSRLANALLKREDRVSNPYFQTGQMDGPF
jgi:hypothetical protein